ncbi:MAG: hypothetical protein CM15mV47_740 [uncultured marine virus]|nr:MAG: hypothetical protein CM15mV47_740 [uncultured marine virus]
MCSKWSRQFQVCKPNQKVAKLREELGTIKERKKGTGKSKKAYEELLRLQPEFAELKSDKKFFAWLEEQPASMQMVFTKITQMREGPRVRPYKADTGQQKRENQVASAAEAETQKALRGKYGQMLPRGKSF